MWTAKVKIEKKDNGKSEEKRETVKSTEKVKHNLFKSHSKK